MAARAHLQSLPQAEKQALFLPAGDNLLQAEQKMSIFGLFSAKT
jgi:hypothetical protein